MSGAERHTQTHIRVLGVRIPRNWVRVFCVDAIMKIACHDVFVRVLTTKDVSVFILCASSTVCESLNIE